MKKKGKLFGAIILGLSLSVVSAGVIPGSDFMSTVVLADEARAAYTAEAILSGEDTPGVYITQAEIGADLNADTMGIPSVAKQTLDNGPTKESPAIIMGAAVNYEKKTGPVEFTPIPGAELVPPYSYFRYNITEEEAKDENGTVTRHKKLSGFDESYYIIRVDVSKLIEGKGEGQYLHVKQEDNKALMVAYGMEGDSLTFGTFVNGTGSKTGAYSLADNAAALKDKTGKDKETPYFDVILMSSGLLSAGADTGKEDAPSADVKLSFYVDDKLDYNPELKLIDASLMPSAFPAEICGQTFENEQEYIKALLAKFYKDENATSENNASGYLVKGSDLEIDVTMDDMDIEGEKPDFWSLRKAFPYQPYDSHIIKLICEVPVLEGLRLEGLNDKRAIILDVNSYDIQIANHKETGAAALTVGNRGMLTIKDSSETSGAELAIGNNAVMVIEDGGELWVDKTCAFEVEYDASTTKEGEAKQPSLTNGEVFVRKGGAIFNNGVFTVEGKEAKPEEQGGQSEPVQRDMRSAVMVVEGLFQNYGCLSLKGELYLSGELDNYGMYKDVIKKGDPDKGITEYHEGIQLTWKDVVTKEGVDPGILHVGKDADGKIYPDASFDNHGDTVLVPGTLDLYGTFNNDKMADIQGHLYICDVDEAIIPVQPTPEDPLTKEKRVAVDPPRKSLFYIDKNSTVNTKDGIIEAAKVALLHNGVLGELTPLGRLPKGEVSEIKAEDRVESAADGSKELVQGKDYNLRDGGVDFTAEYLSSFGGSRVVTINIGYRLYDIPVTGTGTAVTQTLTGDMVALEQESYVYTGKAITPEPVVKNGSVKLAKDLSYTVSYKNNVNAGTATLTVTGKNDYTGKISKTFKITKADNEITGFTPGTKTVKYGKKNVSFKLKAKLKEKAKMKYRLASVPEAAKGKVKVASNGKVTVKKGLAKGSYNVEVEIIAAAGKNCNKTSLKKTFVLEVK